MDFWDRLKEKIKDCDLTHEAVARKLKIPIGTFKNWLLRQTYPDAREVVELAAILNTSVEYLVKGSVDEHSKLTDEERRLIDNFRKLSKYDKGLFMLIADAWNRKHKDK
jgi:transcriptional regulator with XRE-family HTH domain